MASRFGWPAAFLLGLVLLVPLARAAETGAAGKNPADKSAADKSAPPPGTATSDADAEAAVRKAAEQVAADFNAGQVDALTDRFLPTGELIDEAGTAYRGAAEIKALFQAFFERFPGVKLNLAVESVRLVGPLAIEEGTRTMTVASGEQQSRFRYISIWLKGDQGWRIASFRDFADDAAASPREHLRPLAWLLGDWVNEGADATVAIRYQWSEDENFLLGEFTVTTPGLPPRKSTQRIGWDPSAGRIRSWLFDADGGFAEGVWTPIEEGVLIKSSSVNPDGSIASATLSLTPDGDDRFMISGTDRIIGDSLDDDFEIIVTRRPPAASK